MKKTNQIIVNCLLATGIILGGSHVWNIKAQENSATFSNLNCDGTQQRKQDKTTQNISTNKNGLRKRDSSCKDTQKNLNQNNFNCDGTQQRKNVRTAQNGSKHRSGLRKRDGSGINSSNCPRNNV